MDKVILITGASSGIGKTMAIYLTTKGYKVYGSSRTPEKHGTEVFPLLRMDVNDVASIYNCIDEVLKKEGRIDVLVNNAGAGITGPIEEIPDEEIRRNFNTNFFGPLNVMKSVLPSMRKNNGGTIINITSLAGYMGLPYRGIYSANKGALEIITESLSMELKDFNINVVSLAPGDFATNIAAGRYHAPVLKNSPYELPYGNTLKSINEHVDGGEDPILVARQIEKIITSEKPNIHYKVGSFLQKFSIVLKRILPDRIYERMLLNHYKL